MPLPTPIAAPHRAQALRPPSVWALAWRQLGRDLRAGELRLLALAVTLAVAALSAVGFFADRLASGLTRDAAQLLGGDAVVASDRPTPAELVAKAQALGLQSAATSSFPSMARAPDDKGGATVLVAVKAVAPAYPLRGQIQIKPAGAAPAGAATAGAPADLASVPPQVRVGGPQRGQVWVDAALLDTLNLRLGDPLLLGDASLRIGGVIAVEPDRGAGFSSFAPRVMLAQADLPATALVQPASRITYRLALAAAGNSEAQRAAVREFVQFADERIKAVPLRGVRVESLESGRPEMRQTLDRAEKFLNLVALLSALLAAVAVGIAARDFAQRHLDDCALLRVLGLAQRRIAGAYALEFAWVGAAASLLGVLLGYAVHFVFVALLAGLLEANLPAPGPWPALFGMGVGLTLLFAFGLPPVLQLASVPPLRVIRRDTGGLKATSLGVLLAGTLGFAGLLMAVSSDVKLGAIAVGGFALAIAVFAAVAWLAVGLLRRAVPEARAPRWLLLATRQVAARPAFAVLQVSALAVGLLALVLLVLLRTDLIDSWRSATPPDAPNRFIINLQPEQEAPFRAAMASLGVTRYDWYPMIRGRLVAINGREITATTFEGNERAARTLDREFNLSHSAQLPSYNDLSGGQWVSGEADAVSVEDGLAKLLGLKLGDRLRFDIAGISREGRVTSLRKVDWGSFRVNFYVMFPLAVAEGLPATYISAFKAPAVEGFDSKLGRQFPNITNVDISASVAQVQRVLDQVIRAVEYLFGFTLAAGLVVLFAAVSATREARSREFAVMRAMGASGKLLAQVQRAELMGVGALAGVLASLAALAIGWALARYVFEFNWTPKFWVPLAGAAVGAALALAAGWWGLRDVLRRPVLETLRRAGAV